MPWRHGFVGFACRAMSSLNQSNDYLAEIIRPQADDRTGWPSGCSGIVVGGVDSQA